MDQPDDFKSLDKSQRKRRIIDAAIKVFHQKGYRAATLDDVANELGLTKAAIYHYVSSKENLLSIIYMQALENYFANAHKISELDLSPPEKMRSFIRNHIKHVAVENLALLAVFLTEENQLPEEDYRKIRREKRKYNQVVEAIIEAGVAQGCFKPTDARLQANAILALCNSLPRWYKPGQSPYDPDQISEHLIALLEGGYLKGSGRAAESGAAGRGPDPAARRKLVGKLKRQAEALARTIRELESPG